MLTVVLGALAFFAVTAGVMVAGRHLESRPSNDQRRAADRLRALADGPGAGDGDPRRGFRDTVARLGSRLVPRNGARAAALASRLALAGYRDPSVVLYYTAFQLAAVIALAGAAGGTSAALDTGWKRAAMWAPVGGAVGLIAPTFLLTSRVNKRQRAIRNALPDALDIMVLSVEGGASLNAALNWAAEEIQTVHPVLGAELVVVQREVQLGLSTGEAFRAFADRCGIEEARDLAAALLQTEKYGASVGKALRAYADSARQERQVWAEEVAQKASVKIVFPMLLCIFPAIFIVLLGPAAMQMSKIFAR
ncbi:type II secretion system F family protein [Gemmata sp. G18]|uniref:Type II secretion system F family protein n=1 Tax=Gemmata palustris TaxID=2822762 RepID=A0ABS5BXL9_9BACT|nr:type II secretion system F family protein [Gemmata palustris]MBP3958454.1 type II secretion system F family protein [Gemmata palustris]